MQIDSGEIYQRLSAALERDGEEIGGDAANVSQCAADAAQLVGGYIGTAVIPPAVALMAASEVARELYTRLSAPGGVLSPFADAAPVRLARDPLKAAYPILAPYLPGGFA
ncbi:Uncharacterised protein [Actinobaculum suis]|uniref:Uncharacterized protein n=1 Tax=Actinobaculum suis TaxID=1657 RepID=A0A7Z9C8W6_9ACTO|nr:hypothetical protein [Actinobaculum suis]VDG76914.1 Uncharacterised protein [Actinobaculum suis]